MKKWRYNVEKKEYDYSRSSQVRLLVGCIKEKLGWERWEGWVGKYNILVSLSAHRLHSGTGCMLPPEAVIPSLIIKVAVPNVKPEMYFRLIYKQIKTFCSSSCKMKLKCQDSKLLFQIP